MQMALKHQPNKAARQRIVAFVGSPVDATEKEVSVCTSMSIWGFWRIFIGYK